MSELDLFAELEQIKIQITPGAAEVLKNSNIPEAMILKEVKRNWKNKSKAITVKDAINLMLNSDKYVQISQKVHKELKETAQISEQVPRLLRRSFFTLKQFNKPVTAGQIAQRTHRKTSTERVYLNKLVAQGFVVKNQRKDNKSVYSLTVIE
jgi:Fic family protein